MMDRRTAIRLVLTAAGGLAAPRFVHAQESAAASMGSGRQFAFSSGSQVSEFMRLSFKRMGDHDFMVIVYKGQTKEIPMHEVWDAL